MTVEWFNAKLGAPSVSIGPNGMTFTPATRALLGDPECVRIGLDSDARRVCVQPTSLTDEHALPFKSRIDKNGYARLTQRDIARFLASRVRGLDLQKSCRYLAAWDADAGFLEVLLDSPDHDRGRRTRRKPVSG